MSSQEITTLPSTQAITPLSIKEKESNKRYFKEMVASLQKVTKSDYTFIAEIRENHTAKTIVFFEQNKQISNVSYQLKGTPCENVVGSETKIYPEKTYHQFPTDGLISEFKIEGYIGTPVFNEDGTQLGLVVSLFKNPIRNPEFVSSIFEMFSMSIGREMERIRAVESLKIETQRANFVIEGTEAGSWQWNLITHELIINEKWAEIIGFKLAELGEIDFNMWERTLHPDDLENTKNALNDYISGRTHFYNVEFRQRHKDGHWIWIHARGKFVSYLENGTPEWMSGIHLDIQDRKFSEEKIMQQYRELSVAKENAEAASKAKDEFLAVMSHELRTPLNPIMGYASMLLSEAKDELEKEQLEGIIESTDTMTALIENILSYTQLDKSSHEVNRKPHPFVQRLQNLQAKYYFNDNNNKVKIQNIAGDGVDAIEHELTLTYDLDILNRILDHLLSNACKCTQRGNINLNFGWKPESSPNNRMIRIEIEDDGVGIPKEKRKDVFNPFQQVNSSLNRDVNGIGLGLAICKKLIHLIDGEIGIDQDRDLGSLFWIEFPVQ